MVVSFTYICEDERMGKRNVNLVMQWKKKNGPNYGKGTGGWKSMRSE